MSLSKAFFRFTLVCLLFLAFAFVIKRDALAQTATPAVSASPTVTPTSTPTVSPSSSPGSSATPTGSGQVLGDAKVLGGHKQRERNCQMGNWGSNWTSYDLFRD